MFRHAFRDLRRNRVRTLVSASGVAVAVGLLSSLAFFVDSSGARMTQHAVRPVVIDLQAEVTSPLASALSFTEMVSPKLPLTAARTRRAASAFAATPLGVQQRAQVFEPVGGHQSCRHQFPKPVFHFARKPLGGAQNITEE